MKMRLRATVTVVLFCCAMLGLAQTVPYPPAQLQLSGYDTRGSGVPAGTSNTLLTFTVEGDTTGNNSFEVATSDPGVAVSLVLPSGTEVTAANSASLGFTFTIFAGTDLPTDVFQSALSLPGSHTLIQIPAGQPSGTYKIKANATGVSADSGIIATYYSSSAVRAAASTDSANYKAGDTVVLSGMIFDETSPVTGATVTASISAPVSLSAQASLGNYQLVSQQSVNSTLTDYSYSVTLTNSGSAITEVRTQLASLPANVTVLNDTLVFGDVAANSSATSTNTITIERDPSQSFDPSSLQWNVTNPGQATNVAFSDSGFFDAAPGDGVYTGTFVPTSTGAYTAFVSITGTSLAGNNFSRTAVTQFQVTQPLATFVSFSDAQVSSGIAVTASVNVQTAGTYSFRLQLQASNANVIQGGTRATLSPGTQQIVVTFPNAAIYALGVNGPYERTNATLVQTDIFGNTLLADFKADAGPTSGYTLASVAPALSFTGQNSATGVITGAGRTFDLLNVQIGVNAASAANCQWGAMLTDASGNSIDYESSGGAITAGSNSLALNFNGIRIAQSGAGPYVVTSVTLTCGALHLRQNNLFTISVFTASQFTYVAPTFTLSLLGAAPSGTSGSSITVPLQLSSTGAFQGTVAFTVSGLPTGATASFAVPTIVGSGLTNLVVVTPASLAAGSYALTIGYSSGSVSKNLPVTLTIGSSGSSIARVQFVHTYPGNSASFRSSNSAGNAIVVTASWSGTTEAPTISDSLGNTYTALPKLVGSVPGAGEPVSLIIWYALNIKAGSNTVSISGLGADAGMTAVEYSGVASSDALGITSTLNDFTQTATITPNSSGFTPTAGSLVFVAFADETVNQGSVSEGSGYSLIQGDIEHIDIEEDIVNAFSVSQTAGVILSTATSSWIMYVIELKSSAITQTVAPPTVSPTAGTYGSTQSVSITTTTSGASIRYTIDGSTPSESVGFLYSGPVTLSATTTIKAIAYETGMLDSSVTSAAYTITSGSPITRVQFVHAYGGGAIFTANNSVEAF